MGPSPFSFAALRSRGFPCGKGQENYRANANRFQKKHPVIGYVYDTVYDLEVLK